MGFRSFVFIVLVLAFPAALAQPAGKLVVQYIKVGQGDAALIRCPDAKTHMLIDSGDTRYPQSSAQFRSYLNAQFKDQEKKIAVVVASHAHTDHIGSMQWVLQTFQVGTYIDNGDKQETTTWSNLDKTRRKLMQRGLAYINGRQAQLVGVPLCAGVEVTVFSPWGYEKLSDPNDRSVVVRLVHKNVSFLFVCDAEQSAEAVMLGNGELKKLLQAQVLKVGHHGSNTSSTPNFVRTVGPRIAIISSGARDVGTNVGYKHPRWNTLDTYSAWFQDADKGRKPPQARPASLQVWAYDTQKKTWRMHDRPVELWLTTADGNVVIQSDGDTATVVQ